MKTFKTAVEVEDLAFPEGPRWHHDRLWFTDQHARKVHALAADGRLVTIARTQDLPGGLCWLPDGSTLVVYMTERRLMRLPPPSLSQYVDLSSHASFHCNDMVADASGRVYAGNFGFDLHGGAPVGSAEILLVDTDGTVEVFATDVVFPNGSVITPDGDKLLVAETFGKRISAFALDAKGRMQSRSIWADLDGATPDGICLDADLALWIASPGTSELFRICEGGEILARCETLGTPYACMLGGNDRRTLYVCTSETDSPEAALRLRSGRIEKVRVDVPGVGLP
jgi:sugar lactone lactonase YvrE